MYSGDEFYGDEVTSGPVEPAPREVPMIEPRDLRGAVEDSMQDVGLGTDERLVRATQRVRAAALAAIDSVALSDPDGFDSWNDGFRQGWRAAREAVERS